MKGHVDVVNTIILFNKSSVIIKQADKVSITYIQIYAHIYINGSGVRILLGLIEFLGYPFEILYPEPFRIIANYFR